MDPIEALSLLCDTIADGDFAESDHHLAAYRAWRARGGFEPFADSAGQLRGDVYAGYLEKRLASARRAAGCV